MCSRTAPSVWKAVEIAIAGENRSSAHSRSTSGSSPSNSTLSSPASRSSSSSTDMCLPSREQRELPVVRPVTERPERLPVRASHDPPADEADDRVVELLRRDAPEHRARDRRRPVEAAAQVHVVGLASPACGIAHSRSLEPEIADPVLRARVRAPVEVHSEPLGVAAEALLEQLHERIH